MKNGWQKYLWYIKLVEENKEKGKEYEQRRRKGEKHRMLFEEDHDIQLAIYSAYLLCSSFYLIDVFHIILLYFIETLEWDFVLDTVSSYNSYQETFTTVMHFPTYNSQNNDSTMFLNSNTSLVPPNDNNNNNSNQYLCPAYSSSRLLYTL